MVFALRRDVQSSTIYTGPVFLSRATPIKPRDSRRARFSLSRRVEGGFREARAGPFSRSGGCLSARGRDSAGVNRTITRGGRRSGASRARIECVAIFPHTPTTRVGRGGERESVRAWSSGKFALCWMVDGKGGGYGWRLKKGVRHGCL